MEKLLSYTILVFAFLLMGHTNQPVKQIDVKPTSVQMQAVQDGIADQGLFSSMDYLFKDYTSLFQQPKSNLFSLTGSSSTIIRFSNQLFAKKWIQSELAFLSIKPFLIKMDRLKQIASRKGIGYPSR